MRGRRARLVLLPAIGLVIGACAEVPGDKLRDAALAAPAADPLTVRLPPGGERERRTALARPNRTQAAMREAPEVFAAADEVLWDGKPTLEGLWIAHPEARISRQVRMRNPDTGTVVDGALLPRRSGARTGIVISADAADALGLLPTVPARLDLVAIEPQAKLAEPSGAAARQTAGAYAPYAAAEPPVPAAPETADEDGAATRAEAMKATDMAVAQAQIGERAFSGAIVPSSPERSDRGSDPEGRAGPPAGVARAVTSAVAPPMAASEMLPAGAAGEIAAEKSEAPIGAARPPTPAVVPRYREPAAGDATDELSAAEVARVAGAAAPAPATAADAAPATATDAAEAAETKASARETAAPRPDGAAPDRPRVATPIADGKDFIQAGYFRVPEHAADLVRTLAARGVPARNREETVGGTDYNRVIAGPFESREGRERALRQLRAIGITDARPLAGRPKDRP